MEKSTCQLCQSPKPVRQCEVCGKTICKACSQFLDASTFSFLETTPALLKHTFYCLDCFEEHVTPALNSYNEKMELSRELFCFFTTQKKTIPLIRRAKEKVQIKSCVDRDETILRLAFLAVERGFNAIVEVAVTSEKVRNVGYQKQMWSGIAMPAEVDPERLKRSLGLHKILD